MEKSLLKRISLVLLIVSFLFLSFILIYNYDSSDKKEKYDVYFDNFYQFETCYIYDGVTKWPGIKMEHYKNNVYQAKIKNLTNLIFNDGTNQLGAVNFDKNNPYYKNGWKKVTEIDVAYKKVYLSVPYSFLEPTLCYEKNGEDIISEMVLIEGNIYIGFLEPDISTYYYMDQVTKNRTTDLSYLENANHYIYDELVNYTGYKKLVIDEPSSDVNRIYFYKPFDWNDCYIYTWGRNGEETPWPGAKANYFGEGVYYADIDNTYSSYIFNCGLDTEGINLPQTPDLEVENTLSFKYPCYMIEKEGLEELFLINAISSYQTTVYIEKPSNWSNIYILEQENLKKMNHKADNIYECLIPSDTKEIIFSNGDNLKTVPLCFNKEKPFYKLNKWQEFNEEVNISNKKQEQTYQELFDYNNYVSFDIEITDSELMNLENDYQHFSSFNSKSPIYRMCNLKITINSDVYYYEQVGIRMKGNTSRTSFYSSTNGIYNLVHFKLSFNETFDDFEKYDEPLKWDIASKEERLNRTFALMKSIELRWNKNYDSTHIKTLYAYKFYENNDIYAPKSTLSQVNITQFNKLENLGVFELNEPVDELFLEKRLNKEDLDGDLYKVGWDKNLGGSLSLDTLYSIGIEDERTAYFPIYDLKTNKKTSNHQNLKNLIQKLSSSSPNLESLIDTDYFLRFCAISYLVGNPDDFRNNYNNYYIYFLKSSNKAIFIPYDLDRTFGITKDWDPSGNAMTNIDPFSNQTFCGEQKNPLIIKMVTNSAISTYRTCYQNYLKQFSNTSYFSSSNFDEIFKLFQNHYSMVINPTITLVKDLSVSFSLDDSINLNFNQYITRIKEKISSL